MTNARAAIWYTMAVLFVINALNFFDRTIIAAVGEPVRIEFSLDDRSLGILSTAFTLLYAVIGIPLGRIADRFSRSKVLAGGVFIWSFFTFASGIASSFRQIFLFRLGVGVGEASCAPAATSLIGEIFPAEKRSRAMSIFMLGLPVGIALSFFVSGAVAQHYSWRAAFMIAGIPGIMMAVLALFIHEPRTAAAADVSTRTADSYINMLRSPTMRWLIVSGALHNFCLYALSSFMTPYLMRVHGLGIRDASLIAMLVNGVFTLPGLLLGGYLGDAVKGKGLSIVGVAVLIAIPLFAVSMMAEAGNTTLFLWTMGTAFALMYFYYSITYAAIADITPPEDRGAAMSVYFLAMYVLGGALGPWALGLLSDYFTRRAAALAGVTGSTSAALEPFRGAGLQSAMYIVPIMCLALAAVMFLASRSRKIETT